MEALDLNTWGVVWSSMCFVQIRPAFFVAHNKHQLPYNRSKSIATKMHMGMQVLDFSQPHYAWCPHNVKHRPSPCLMMSDFGTHPYSKLSFSISSLLWITNKDPVHS